MLIMSSLHILLSLAYSNSILYVTVACIFIGIATATNLATSFTTIVVMHLYYPVRLIEQHHYTLLVEHQKRMLHTEQLNYWFRLLL